MLDSWAVWFSNVCFRWKHVTCFSNLSGSQGMVSDYWWFWFVWFQKTKFKQCWKEKNRSQQILNNHHWPSVLVLLKNWIQADYHRFIPAEECGSDFGCEDWHTDGRVHMLQESSADFWHTGACRSQNTFFYFNYMASSHEWEPKLLLHWPWKCLGGLWWNEAYVFWWFLESGKTQNQSV